MIAAVFLVASPFIALGIQAFKAIFGADVQIADLLFWSDRRFGVFLRSVFWAFGVGFGGIVLAVPTVLGIGSWLPKKNHHWVWFLLVLACLPAYIQAIAWQTLAQWLGIGYLAYGWGVSWWVQVMVYFPLAVVLASVGLSSVDASLLDAGRLHYSDWKVFRHIWLPLAAPYLLASICILFVLALVDYTIPSLFQVASYPLEIFAEFSASGKPETAMILAVPVILITLVVMTWAVSQFRPAGMEASVQRSVFDIIQGWDWPKPFSVFQKVAAGLLLIQFTLPLIALAGILIKQGQFFVTLRESVPDLTYSILISMAAAFLVVVAAVPVSRFLVFSKNRFTKFLIGLVVILSLAVPASVVGVGIIALLSRPMLSFIYGTDVGLIFALVVRFYPIAVLVLVGLWRRSGMAWAEAAKLLDANALRMFVLIILPVTAPTIITAFLFVLALNLGELGASLLVVPPGSSTITIRIYNYLHYGAGESVAGMSLALIIIILGLGLLAMFGLQAINRRNAGN